MDMNWFYTDHRNAMQFIRSIDYKPYKTVADYMAKASAGKLGGDARLFHEWAAFSFPMDRNELFVVFLDRLTWAIVRQAVPMSDIRQLQAA